MAKSHNYTITRPGPVPICEIFPCYARKNDPDCYDFGLVVLFTTPTFGIVLGSTDPDAVSLCWSETHSPYQQPDRWEILKKGTKINLNITV